MFPIAGWVPYVRCADIAGCLLRERLRTQPEVDGGNRFGQNRLGRRSIRYAWNASSSLAIFQRSVDWSRLR